MRYRSCCCAVIALPLMAASPVPTDAVVDTAQGPIRFSSIQVFRGDPREAPCGFIGRIENATSTAWENLSFNAKISGRDLDDGQVKTFNVTVHSDDLEYKESSWKIWGACPNSPPKLSVEKIKVSLLSGEAVDDQIKDTREKEQTAARRRAAKDPANYPAYLATLPVLFNGNESIFVGFDEKCSDQFVQALSMDGLEKRKRIAELITYECGFLVPAGTHVMIGRKTPSKTFVSPVEGLMAGKSGWVPSDWIRPR